MTENAKNPSQESAPDAGSSDPSNDGRIPRPAIIVVLAGLVLSVIIFGISLLPGADSAELEWDTVQGIEAPNTQKVGGGSFSLARLSLAALAPNEMDDLIYRVAGVVRVDSKGPKPTQVRCDVAPASSRFTSVARSEKLRAAWPKPSDALQMQDVPETSFVRFSTTTSTKVDLPVRDVARRYTDSSAPTTVDWVEYEDEVQNWVWEMKEGTGPGSATLPWIVIFATEERPKGTISCSATVGNQTAEAKVPYFQEEWPIIDDEPDPTGAESGDMSDVG